MNKEEKELLKLFQCEDIRFKEEDFAQMFTETLEARLFFVNENQAFTDGTNIVVDPSLFELFCDTEAQMRTEQFFNMNNEISNDKWLALKMITRHQSIHECLHIIYTNFPSIAAKSKKADTKSKKKLLAMIANIIEDAFIDAAGCSVYDNLSSYIVWGRVLTAFRTMRGQSTIERTFSKPKEEWTISEKILRVQEILEYLGYKYVYPMFECFEPSKEIELYVNQVTPIFDEACIEGDADKRENYAIVIFEILKELLPEDEEFDFPELEELLHGMKTHGENPSAIKPTQRKGRYVKLTRKAFSNLDGSPLDFTSVKEYLENVVIGFLDEKEKVIAKVNYNGKKVTFHGSDFECSKIHENMEIKVTNPKINYNLKKAYNNIVKKYKLNINGYVTRFSKLLKEHIEEKEEGHIFGVGITSRYFSDIKKRYWYRKLDTSKVPDIAIMLLIDGSGSMFGGRREGAIVSSVILHEVLKKTGIEHMIVEHRAIYGEPTLQHNILVDLKGKNEEKYNLLMLEAYEGTREGLTLYWAEKYLMENSSAEIKLIIMISDGVPAHQIDDSDMYVPPVSVKDTANAVRKITSRGTKIVAIALDEVGEDDCYRMLREMYPAVVSCTDLSKLTGQLLMLVSRELE